MPCLNCANFLAARDEYFSTELRELLSELGIDWRKEAEVFDLRGEVVDGHLLYSGWFHTFGMVVAEPVNQNTDFVLARDIHLYVMDYRGAPRVLDESQKHYSHRMVEVSFTFEMPWVLAEP